MACENRRRILDNDKPNQGNAMIYELRTYTVKPGTTGDMVKAASTVSHGIRKDDYGKLEGYWYTDIGPLNQVMHLWSYPDLNERARLRAALALNPRWGDEYVPLIRPLIVRQDIRLLNGVITWNRTLSESKLAPSRHAFAIESAVSLARASSDESTFQPMRM